MKTSIVSKIKQLLINYISSMKNYTAISIISFIFSTLLTFIYLIVYFVELEASEPK